MEIMSVVPGVILVAVNVWVLLRIKRAMRQYEKLFGLALAVVDGAIHYKGGKEALVKSDTLQALTNELDATR